jgi:hypothetical protein
MKRIKLGVRSEKELCWIYVRRVGFFQGGSLKRSKTHEKILKLLRRIGANLQTGGGLLPPLDRGAQGGAAA